MLALPPQLPLVKIIVTFKYTNSIWVLFHPCFIPQVAIYQSDLQTMASGFNDFPRASHPTSQEYHVDLRCWMTLASGVMAKIAQLLGGM